LLDLENDEEIANGIPIGSDKFLNGELIDSTRYVLVTDS